MFKSLLKWTVWLTAVAAVVAGVARLLGSRSGGPGTSGPIATIGGDTWPPVPVNPDRQG